MFAMFIIMGNRMGSMSSIGSRLVPKSTEHIIPLSFFSRSARLSFRMGEIRVESD
jgi:hypothetical protein